MQLNFAWMWAPKSYSLEEAEAERNPAKVRALRLMDVKLESLRGRLRQFPRLESLYFQCLRVDNSPDSRADFSPALRAEILELKRLKSFSLLNVRIWEFPLWLAPLPRLEYLMVRGAYIQEIPREIGQFSQLRVLRLGNNDLFSVPVEIAELRKLEWLNLPDTFVSEIPLPILQLPKLRALGLANTNFTPAGAAQVKAQFPNASVWPATATGLPQPHFYLRRELNKAQLQFRCEPRA